RVRKKAGLRVGGNKRKQPLAAGLRTEESKNAADKFCDLRIRAHMLATRPPPHPFLYFHFVSLIHVSIPDQISRLKSSRNKNKIEAFTLKRSGGGVGRKRVKVDQKLLESLSVDGCFASRCETMSSLSPPDVKRPVVNWWWQARGLCLVAVMVVVVMVVVVLGGCDGGGVSPFLCGAIVRLSGFWFDSVGSFFIVKVCDFIVTVLFAYQVFLFVFTQICVLALKSNARHLNALNG
ncbi:hypothetical protein M8C21_009457, partial [Ambrosia artemisiifolia]